MKFVTDDSRWQAVQTRDPRASGHFVTAVKTTGIYCQASCPARQPLRKNITFYDTPAAAQAAGFRPCKKCWTTVPSTPAPILEAIRRIESAETPPTLTELAEAVGLSPFHFQKQFKRYLGVTPKAFMTARKQERMQANLRAGQGVTEALYAAGYGASSRLYEESNASLGMTPSTFRRGGKGETIHYATAECVLGRVIVAATERGVCLIAFADKDTELIAEARERFPDATLQPADAAFSETVASVVALTAGQPAADLPLDVRGTAFQRRVWEELRAIPTGTTVTYSEVAKRIGKPKAVRAVANACGDNPVAVVVPCHRVVGSDGKLHGYRWGVERKKTLLKQEEAGKPTKSK